MRVMNSSESPVKGIPNVTWPQELAEAEGMSFITPRATGLISDCGIWLFGKGAPPLGLVSVSALPQAAEARVEKSPVSAAVVGTWVMDCGGFERLRVP